MKWPSILENYENKGQQSSCEENNFAFWIFQNIAPQIRLRKRLRKWKNEMKKNPCYFLFCKGGWEEE